MRKTNNGVSGARRRERAKEESGVPAPEDGAGAKGAGFFHAFLF